jgi:ketosteroid isomerase-like protein
MQCGDVETYLGLCTDDVVFEFPFAPPGRPARVEGREALGRYLAAIPSRIEARALSNLEIHQTVNSDVAVVEMTITGKVKGTGEPYEMSYVIVLTVREGRIARYRDYWNPLKSLSASQEG